MDYIELVKLIGIQGAIIIISLYLYSKFYFERKLDKYRNEDLKEIETLKGLLEKNRTIISDLIRNYSVGSEIVQNKRITGIEKFWEAIIKIRNFNSTGHFFFTILTKNEVEDLFKNEDKNSIRIRGYLDNINYPDLGIITEDTSITENFRPFVGEELWIHFFAYRAFVLRSNYLLINGREKQKIIHWLSDRNSKAILSQVINENELNFIYNDEFHSFEKAITLLENKMLNLMQKVISGEIEITNSIEKVKQIASLVVEMEKSS